MTKGGKGQIPSLNFQHSPKKIPENAPDTVYANIYLLSMYVLIAYPCI